MNQEELKQRLIELLQEYSRKPGAGLDGVYEWADDISDHLIENGVTIRERGEWTLERGDYGKMICSSCKGQCPTEKKPDPYEDFQIAEFHVESDFCPHCGADMRGVKE
jgi:hypothetical protein